jgi:hypothetical protein
MCNNMSLLYHPCADSSSPPLIMSTVASYVYSYSHFRNVRETHRCPAACGSNSRSAYIQRLDQIEFRRECSASASAAVVVTELEGSGLVHVDADAAAVDQELTLHFLKRPRSGERSSWYRYMYRYCACIPWTSNLHRAASAAERQRQLVLCHYKLNTSQQLILLVPLSLMC